MPEKMHLLEACANQLALAIEVDRLQETNKSDSPKEASHARNALLHAVSHDLRTPLVAIMGAARTQVEMANTFEPDKIKQIGQDIYSESEHLNRLINNLLQMSYLEEGTIKLQTKPSSLKDIITLAINASYKKTTTRKIHVNIPDNLPDVPIDNTLIQEVLINLIDNAVKFTSTDTPIYISAIVENNKVVVSVEDQGPGIASDEVNKLFEKFYRGRLLTTERGLGLGLAICRSIIKAHGGEIWAENRAGGGSTFRFTLPLHLTGELKNA